MLRQYIRDRVNGECGSFTNASEFTNRKWTDPTTARLIFSALAKFRWPEAFRATKPRPHATVTCGIYDVGQAFGLHTDTGCYFSETEETRWTLLVYLTDAEAGGETRFYDRNMDVACTVTPRKGRAVLFDIDIMHEALPLLAGSKEWVGIEIIGKRRRRT